MHGEKMSIYTLTKDVTEFSHSTRHYRSHPWPLEVEGLHLDLPSSLSWPTSTVYRGQRERAVLANDNQTDNNT